MRSIRRLAVAAAACVMAASAAAQANAQVPRALSPTDAALYAAAFDAAAKGDYDTAREHLDRVSDRCLEGYLEFDRLMGPKVKASFEDLTGWLGKFADLPGADRIKTLAKKRAPSGMRVEFEAEADDKGQTGLYVSARDAFYSGDPKAAYTLAVATGERWVAGLAAFRLQNFPDALTRFEAVASDPNEDPWLRAGAAYWAARASIASGKPEEAPGYLRMAARWPQTFYGMLAENQLGYEPGAGEGMPEPRARRHAAAPQPAGGLIRAAFQADDERAIADLVERDPRARRAAALMQIGRTEEAALEMKRGYGRARTDDERQLWIALAVALNTAAEPPVRQAPSRYRPFNPEDFPAPELQPLGGYTVDRALVFALIRQESRFNPQARSGAGAIGLMQVRAGTAADATGDDKFKSNGSLLYDPAVNLRAGQDYIDFLQRKWTRYDLVRTIAAYNGGPGSVLKGERNAGLTDPLMIVESLPAHQTRDYVEKVMTNYWTYRRLFGERTRSLDALASGATIIDVRLDR